MSNDDELTNLSWLSNVNSVFPCGVDGCSNSSNNNNVINGDSNTKNKRERTGDVLPSRASKRRKSSIDITSPSSLLAAVNATSTAVATTTSASLLSPLSSLSPPASPVKKFLVHQKTNADKLAERHRELSATSCYRDDPSLKPPFSYAALICLAMRESGLERMTLAQIYDWIRDNFAFYRGADTSWQNSIRHNLSLNRCFEKVARDKGEKGKGGFWTLSKHCRGGGDIEETEDHSTPPPSTPTPPISNSKKRSKSRKKRDAELKVISPLPDGIKIEVEKDSSKISYNFEADKATTTSVILGIQNQLSQLQQGLQQQQQQQHQAIPVSAASIFTLPPLVKIATAPPQLQINPPVAAPPPPPPPPAVLVDVQASLAASVPLPPPNLQQSSHHGQLQFSDILTLMQLQEESKKALPPPPPLVQQSYSFPQQNLHRPMTSLTLDVEASSTASTSPLPPSTGPHSAAMTPTSEEATNNFVDAGPRSWAPTSSTQTVADAVLSPPEPEEASVSRTSDAVLAPASVENGISHIMASPHLMSPPSNSTSSSRLHSSSSNYTTFDSEDLLSLDLPLYGPNCSSPNTSPSVILQNKFNWPHPMTPTSTASGVNLLPALDDTAFDFEGLMDLEGMKLPPS